ncbi:MAG: UPF0058 family protein [Methanolobus sp.]|uniref:UPF0058 family protein n=1 Tax=Methanolobus sp. TaxID=1874737 RepID=UPI00028AA1CE|nr:UPF0058 family protein [Methanolobus sp.]AFV24004.1 hypothetical protein Mpsy_1797 [Methanolobus psychrophilus R15]MDP2216094.1 UPF0058 family protein [Methanolobus sp.]
MHKDELIQLHTLMAQIKRHFEYMGIDYEFSHYDSLAISPLHVHRSKAEHKHAIFVLGNDLASVFSKDDMSGMGRTSTRMQELAQRAGIRAIKSS